MMKRILPISTAFLLIIFFLIVAAYFVLYLDTNLYTREFTRNNAAGNSGMQLNEILKIQDQLMRFLRGDFVDLAAIRANMYGKSVIFFNEKVIQHMEDVRAIFRNVIHVGKISYIFLIGQLLYFSWLKSGSKNSYLQIFRKSYLFMLVALGLGSSLVFFFFNQAFILFHRIFFSNDLWIFDARTDFIIRWLPEQFFRQVALEILLIFLFLSLASIALSRLYQVHLAKKEKQHA